MASRPTDEAMALWVALLEAHALATEHLDAALRAKHGLTLERYDVLHQLHAAGGSLRMSELATRSLLSRSNCTRLVDRMARDGLVDRAAVTGDHRGVLAVLTPAGRALVRRAGATHLAGLAALVDPSGSTAQLAAATEVLRALRAAVER